MTYCVGVMLNSGLVLASDSRTNAGVDQVATFRKMTVHERPGDRVIVLLSSGNLAVTQTVINLLDEKTRGAGGQDTLLTTNSMYGAACLVGEAMREVQQRDGSYLLQNNIDASASFILGGQIRGEKHRLFNIYTEGNFIEATPETPFFQIGETKYGKPVLNRVISGSTDLIEAAKCVLVSFDSTMLSNITVGLPIDLVVYERDSLRVGVKRRIMEGDPYFDMIHRQWGEGLKKVFAELPDPHWEE